MVVQVNTSSKYSVSGMYQFTKNGLSEAGKNMVNAVWEASKHSLIESLQKYLTTIETGYQFKEVKVGLNQLGWIPLVSILSGCVRKGLGAIIMVAAMVEFVARIAFMATGVMFKFGDKEIEFNGKKTTVLELQRELIRTSTKELGIHGLTNVIRGAFEAEGGIFGNLLCIIYDLALPFRFRYPCEQQNKS